MLRIKPVIILMPAIFFSLGMSSPSDEAVQTAAPSETKSHRHQTVKPHAGVLLDYQRPPVMQVGGTVVLHLDFTVRAPADSLEVSIRNKGLQLDSSTEYQFAAARGDRHRVTLNISALQDGVFYLDIEASLVTAGQGQARSFSIPITVGDPTTFKTTSEPAAGYKVVPSEGVISMPAVETTD